MMRDHDQPPTPEQLTAYHDGELDSTARAAIDAWLTDHPDPLADLAAWRRVDAVWKDTRPDDPGEDAWVATRAQIDRRLAEPVRRAGGWWLGVGTAAAVLLGVGWAPWPPRTPPTTVGQVQPVVEPEEEPFEIVARDSVRVISMDGSGYVDIDGQRVSALIGADLPVPDEELRPTSVERTKVLTLSPGIVRDTEWGVPMVVDEVVLTPGWQP